MKVTDLLVTAECVKTGERLIGLNNAVQHGNMKNMIIVDQLDY